MLIIADYRIPKQASQKLQKLGDVALLQTQNIVYDSICGHPDIFLCKTPEKLIVAPQTPENIIKKLKYHAISFEFGIKSIGNAYPKTVPYNAVVTDKYIIHQTDFTDESILNLPLEKIKISQGYTQCNTIVLNNRTFIVSDKGMKKKLKANGLETYYFSPENIQLYQQNHGFLGGCCGIYERTIYFYGKLNIPNADNLQEIILSKGYQIEYLSDLPLADYGGLFFLSRD